MKHIKHHPIKDKDSNLSKLSKKQDVISPKKEKKIDAEKHLSDIKVAKRVTLTKPSNKKLSSEKHLSGGKAKKVDENFSELNHIETFENFNGVNEEFFPHLFSKEKKTSKKDELISKIDDLLATGAIGNKESILSKAEDDNYNGELTTTIAGKSSRLAGKKLIIYTPKLTTLQKIAAGSNSSRIGN